MEKVSALVMVVPEGMAELKLKSTWGSVRVVRSVVKLAVS